MIATLKMPKLADYLKELEVRGPNTELVVRVALRKPRMPGSGSSYDLYLTSSYIRDIGPEDDYQSTLILVLFDYRVGQLTGIPFNDDPLLAEGEALFNQVTGKVRALQLDLAPGYYTQGR